LAINLYNKYIGLITGISTNGTTEAKIRAAGSVGDHAIRLRTGKGGGWTEFPMLIQVIYAPLIAKEI